MPKLGYIACSLFGDLASFDGYEGKIGITDGNSTRYFFFTKKDCDTEILQALTAMLNVMYTSSEEMILSESGYTFESLSLNQRFDTIARYIESNLEVCLLKLSERRRAEIHATKGGAFAAVAKAEKRRPLCAETACPWRSNKEYCVWPSCFKKNISTAPKYPDSDEELAEETESSVETTGVVSEPETVKPEMEDVSNG